MSGNISVLSTDEGAKFFVRGTVTAPDGQPARGLAVVAFDQHLRKRRELGRAQTGKDGRYEIAYDAGSFQNGGADLVIEVQTSAPEVLYTSPVRFNASPEQTIDVSLTRLGSEPELDRIARELTPLLESQDLSFETLEENKQHRDITFAAGETGIPHERLMAFAVAHRLPGLAKQTTLEPPFWFAALRTYSLSTITFDPVSGIEDLARIVLTQIPGKSWEDLETGLRRAMEGNLIAGSFEGRLPQWKGSYQAIRRSAARADGLLAAAGIPEEEHEAFLDLAHAGGSRAERLSRVPEGRSEQAARVETVLALNDLTLGNRELLKALQPEVSEPSRLRDLARKTPAEWQQVIERAGAVPPESVAGSDEEEKRSNYAALLAEHARRAYPTAAFAGDLERALAAPETLAAEGKPALALRYAQEILGFLDERPDFELGRTSLAGVEGEFAGELKAVQRVFKLAPSFAASNTLLGNGLHSANAIYQMGETQFVRSFAGSPGFDEKAARDAYQRAANTYAAVATLVGDLRATQSANDVLGLTNKVSALARLPNLASLFGKADLCECEHCRSIFSPAAYLADLLMFLRDRKDVDGNRVKSLLLQRRPDLGTIELSCDNSNVPLPYVDLVCELLEERVAPTGQAHQTHGTAEERAAYPESVNDAAYQKLREAKRNGPLTLPFDLPVEEVRAYLAFAGLRRCDLMTLFRGTDAPNNPSAVDIVAERLGIAKGEQDLIFVAGEVDVPAPFTVDAFLTRTGLEYADLLRLLSLKSVNPNGAIEIEHTDSSCDTVKKNLTGLDRQSMDRIHRFLRLWRKLGWEMWEVDLVIQHPALGKTTLDPDLVKTLDAFLRLKERLALSVDQLCALFGDLDTVPKFTKAFHDPAPPFYERLFLDKRVTNPPDPALAIAEVTKSSVTAKIDEHLPPILGALQLSSADLAILRGLSGPGLVIDDKLSLKNLSFLYRHALLSRLLHLSAADWKSLLLVRPDPFTDPAAVLALVELVDRLQANGLTVDQLSWVLRADHTAGAAVTETNVTATLTALRDALKTVAEPLRKDGAVQQLSTALRLPEAVVEKLLGIPESHPLLGEYAGDAFATSNAPMTSATFRNQYDGFYWLHRVATVCLAFTVTSPDLEWMLREPAQKGVLDLAALSSTSSTPANLVAPLLNLGDFLRLHRAVSRPGRSLLDVVTRLVQTPSVTAKDLAADIETLTGWPKGDAETVVNLESPAAYQKIEAWQRLRKAITMIERLNGDAQSLLPLAAPALSSVESAALKRMLRSKYEEKQWLDLSKTIQDTLRERKRDSLVAYLLTQPQPNDAPSESWDHPDDLYAYHLIDVQMCSCQLTSRIVQASAAVQLFVQRCSLGLEPKVRVSVEEDDHWSQWEWMKHYRVWEANRRVFAYPENYAEPELRRDKSELFANLEDELLQNEINRDNVETAFLHYLERLDDIAQLEIVGTCYQESNHTLHVFGRTPNSDPRTYYHRKFVDERRWTAWSKVDVDVKCDYFVPLVAHERLHLVWPEFREEPIPPGEMKIPSPGDKVPLTGPTKKYKISLAVSEQRNGKWLPKKLSRDTFEAWSIFGAPVDSTTTTVLPLDFTWWPSPEQPRGPFLIRVATGIWEAYFDLMGHRGCPELFTSFLYQGTFVELPTFILPMTRFDRDDFRLQKNLEVTQGAFLTGVQSFIVPFTLLNATPGMFKITYPHYMSVFDQRRVKPTLDLDFDGNEIWVTLGTFYSWFYADQRRTFFVRPRFVGTGPTPPPVEPYYKEAIELFPGIVPPIPAGYTVAFDFNTFYHPLTGRFARELDVRGVEGLMARETQFIDTGFDFVRTYLPTRGGNWDLPREIVDFAPDGSYSMYNWELFFHAPLMIADRLSKDQRFEDALRWFHFIFDPVGAHDKDPVTGAPAPAPQKLWITKPFFQRQDPEYLQQRIENLLRLLANDPADPTPPGLLQELIRQVQDWRANPFDPHLVAQFRTVAYQKLTVMKYIQNLISWGDQRFQEDTLESVNEAAQLYVLAAEILGPRPRRVPPAGQPQMETFNQLESKLDAFSNAIVALENMIPPMPTGGGSGRPQASLPGLYFCIPQNDQLLGLWDTVADRLYKIRHCLNIEGVARQLALFAPPIDPMLLVRATAAGVDIASALADIEVSSIPHYRFATMIQKANELVSDVKALGAALLAALEKKDAEALALLRQSQEISVLQAAREVKRKQIDEAQNALEAAQRNLDTVSFRRDYYATRKFRNNAETAATILSIAALVHQGGAMGGELLGAIMAAIPNFDAGAEGFGGSPAAVATTGGMSLSTALDLGAKAMTLMTGLLERAASLASTEAGYQRRWDEWQMQLGAADREMKQFEKQIASAEVRLAITQKELDNHDLQIANSRALDDFMRSKYTNQELYQWMIGQISRTYFQTYQLAYDTAKRAEQCFRYELGLKDSSFIRFGAWDTLHKGLMAGERLQLDLRRLESAYLDQNRRELECTKHVSLALLNPRALLELKDKGTCTFSLPEEIFDLDFPGHFFRRIKSVSLSIPCVAGPQTTVSCSLRLLENSVRIDPAAGSQYPHNTGDDVRFRDRTGAPVASIATSSGQNDSGMFELSFNDARYLPFEGAGAISTWQLDLVEARELRQFEYQTISDAILHLRYTAREDGGLKSKAVEHLKAAIKDAAAKLPLLRLFDLKHEFPTEWYAFFHPASGGKLLRLPIRKQSFPVFAQDAALKIHTVSLLARSGSDKLFAKLGSPFNQNPMELTRPASDRLYAGDSPVLDAALDESKPWELQLGKTNTDFEGLTFDDVPEGYLIVQYTL
jgi:hypothetical protein